MMHRQKSINYTAFEILFSYFQNTLYVSIIPSIFIRNSSYSACVPGVKPRRMLNLSRRFDVYCSRRVEGEPYIGPS